MVAAVRAGSRKAEKSEQKTRKGTGRKVEQKKEVEEHGGEEKEEGDDAMR